MNQVATVNPSVGLLDLQAFENAQRIGNMLSQSTLVPEQYRATIAVKTGKKDENGNPIYEYHNNPNGLSNCIIALNMANRIGADPLMVMQNLYLIEGRPAWSSQFILASLNSCGRFSALRFDIEDLGDLEVEYTEYEWTKTIDGKSKKKPVNKKITIRNLTCVAWATERETGERIESSKISVEMAVKEGWYQKNGSKWQTMPEQMLRYRSASFFGRVYAPEILMGLRSVEEENEIIDVTPVVSEEKEDTSKDLKERLLKTKNLGELKALHDEVLELQILEQRKRFLKLYEAQELKLNEIGIEEVKEKEVVKAEQQSTQLSEEVNTELKNVFLQTIEQAQTLEQLDEVCAKIKTLSLSEPEKTQLRQAFKAKREQFVFPDMSIQSIVDELEAALEVPQLDTILATRFKPFTASMTEKQINIINDAYSRKFAELTE